MSIQDRMAALLAEGSVNENVSEKDGNNAYCFDYSDPHTWGKGTFYFGSKSAAEKAVELAKKRGMSIAFGGLVSPVKFFKDVSAFEEFLSRK